MRRRGLHGSEVGCGHRVCRGTAENDGNCDSSRGADRAGAAPARARGGSAAGPAVRHDVALQQTSGGQKKPGRIRPRSNNAKRRMVTRR
ncbi:hypothetical protein C6Q00_25675 [Burkholderia multivorans]|nr:hypothetical protein C6Q00_25675 [Burkholderia multivorans]